MTYCAWHVWFLTAKSALKPAATHGTERNLTAQKCTCTTWLCRLALPARLRIHDVHVTSLVHALNGAARGYQSWNFLECPCWLCGHVVFMRSACAWCIVRYIAWCIACAMGLLPCDPARIVCLARTLFKRTNLGKFWAPYGQLTFTPLQLTPQILFHFYTELEDHKFEGKKTGIPVKPERFPCLLTLH